MDIEALIHSIVALIVALIGVLMLISLIREFYFNNNDYSKSPKNERNNNNYYGAIKNSSIICLIAYIIRLFTLFLLHIPIYCELCGISHTTAVSWQIISALFLFLSKPIIQIHFIIRLYFTFKSSAFESNIFTFIILSSIVIIEILCILLYFISGLIQLNGDKDSPLLVEDDFDDGDYGKPFESTFSIILLCIAVITDLIVSYIITHLFISKLFKLLVSSIKSRDDQNKIILIEQDTKMINTITRITLLSSMTMILTQFYFGLQLIHILWISSYVENEKISYHKLDVPLAALSIIDSLVAIFSIYLNFVFSRKSYKLFCNLCHKGLENICKKLTERKVVKEQEITVDNEYHLMNPL